MRWLVLGVVVACGHSPRVAVLISANTEWKVLHETLKDADQKSPVGEWFVRDVAGQPVLFFHGGWGKIAAAASTQYVIDRWRPRLLVNLGTCGGFAGKAAVGDVVLAEKTVVYDIVEAMGDPDEAIADYTTVMDTSAWPRALDGEVRRDVIVSGDRDLLPEEVPRLAERFKASVGDWESGAIAWVAHRNGVQVLILRGVSDVVGAGGSVAYGSMESFESGTRRVLAKLLGLLERAVPSWYG